MISSQPREWRVSPSAKIEYSPAIIYHYFEDKNALIHALMNMGYGGILRAISGISIADPLKKLEEMTRRYIKAALDMPDIYKTVLLSGQAQVLSHTSALFQGASEKRQAIGMLCECLRQIKDESTQTELTAQIIWTSTFGLIIRLILERDLPEEQKNALIERHIGLIKTAAI